MLKSVQLNLKLTLYSVQSSYKIGHEKQNWISFSPLHERMIVTKKQQTNCWRAIVSHTSLNLTFWLLNMYAEYAEPLPQTIYCWTQAVPNGLPITKQWMNIHIKQGNKSKDLILEFEDIAYLYKNCIQFACKECI